MYSMVYSETRMAITSRQRRAVADTEDKYVRAAAE